MCKWIHLADKNGPEHACQQEGSPYCEEHMAEFHYHTWNELAALEKQPTPGSRLVRAE